MSRRKQQSAFDQVSEFDRGRIVAYRHCGLSFRKIGSRVGRNQTTVMRICNRWMQEGTMDRRGRSHQPQCTTSREDRQIVRMAVTDHSVTSRTVAQHSESVTLHHSVSARTIRCRFSRVVCPTHCRYLKQPTLHLRGVGASCPSLPSGLGHSHISTEYCATTCGMHCPKVLRKSPD
ncbi:transposable element Tcb1 transposase [Trichonephila clavipes]|nr:transposable element Tcb1 transposase [Trichonephila clavipes]